MARLGQPGLDDRKLVAAEPRDRVGLADHGLEARRGLLEQRVAGGVAAHVVDLLEAIEVEAQHRDLVAVAPRPRQRLLEAVAEQHAVGQAGQRVVVGHEPDLRLGRLALGDVADRRDARAPALVVHGAGQHLDRDVAAVGVQQPGLVGALRAVPDPAPDLVAVLDGDEAQQILPDHLRQRLAGEPGERVVAVEQTTVGVDRDALEGRVGQLLQPGAPPGRCDRRGADRRSSRRG